MKLTVFIALPLREPFLSFLESAIRPAIEDLAQIPQVAPDLYRHRDIMSNIFEGIWQARAVVADLTGTNPNVLYELGIAVSLNKPNIILSQDVDGLPFDLKRDRVIKYDDTAAGIAKLRQDLRDELINIFKEDWVAVPSWKAKHQAAMYPVSILLAIEEGVRSNVWIIEPEESFQDISFYDVILANLRRGIQYRFIVIDREDVEASFKETLGQYYGGGAQVLYIPERQHYMPFSIALFDPESRHGQGFQYLPNGITSFGTKMSRPQLVRARLLFRSLWRNDRYRRIGKLEL